MARPDARRHRGRARRGAAPPERHPVRLRADPDRARARPPVERRGRVLRGGARAHAARTATGLHGGERAALLRAHRPRARRGPLYIGRHAIADEHNALLAINWRAPAAEPFYAATPARPHGLMRRRRLDIEDHTVHAYVDERLAGGPAEIHLTEAIVADITRQRVGEMRQIISTITPEQYELIARRLPGALVVQGGPGTGKTAVGLHRAAWLLYADPALARAGVLVVGPNRTFIAYIAQVLPALGEQSVEQRPIDALVSVRPRSAPEPEAQAALLGSGAHGDAARAAAVEPRGAARGGGGDPGRPPAGRRRARRGGGDPRRGARAVPRLRRGPRALPRPARRPARHARRSRARASALVSPAEAPRPCAARKAFQRLVDPQLAAADPGGARRGAVQEPPAPRPPLADGLLAGAEIDELIAHGPPPARRAPCRRACSRCSTRRAG